MRSLCRGIRRGQSPQADCDRRFWRRTSSESGWDVTGVSLRGASGEEFHELGMVVNGNDNVQALPSGGYSPAEGTYPDATLKVDISRDDGGTQVRESLEFPFPFKVRPDEP